MADRIAFMNEGNILTIGKPIEVFSNPRNEFVARALGFKNLFEGVISGFNSVSEIDCQFGNLKGDLDRAVHSVIGEPVKLLLDERMIEIHEEKPNGQLNTFQAILSQFIFKGSEYDLKLKIGSKILSLIN